MALKKRTKRAIIGSIADSVGAVEVIEKLEQVGAGSSYDEMFSEHSVNKSLTKLGVDGELVFVTRKGADIAGNFNGGGNGNKPIAGIKDFQQHVGKKLSELELVISQDVDMRVQDSDPDQEELGVSYNLLIDLQGNGNPADYKVLVITNTLGEVDKYGRSGPAGSVDDFNIDTDHFYIVTGLPGETLPWTSAEYRKADVTTPYPNCTIISALSFDSGHPAGEKMAALTAQIGGSGNALRSVAAVTRLEINGKKLV